MVGRVYCLITMGMVVLLESETMLAIRKTDNSLKSVGFRNSFRRFQIAGCLGEFIDVFRTVWANCLYSHLLP